MLKELKNLLREGNPHFVSKLLSFLVITISLLVLVGGWALDIAFLRSLIPNTTTMKINTALLFLMMGLAVWLQTDKKTRRLSTLLASFALLLSGLTLLEYAFSRDLGIDQLFGIDPYTLANAFPGRPSMVTALTFFLIAGTYLLPYSYLSWGTLFLLNLLLYPALLGYASHNLSFYGLLGYESISLPTTVAFIFLIGSIIVTHPVPGMNTKSSDLLGSRVFRTIAPTIIPLGLFWGWISHVLHHQGWIEGNLENILLNVFMVANAMLVIYWIAFVLNKTDLELRALEDNYTKLLGNTGSLVAVLDKDGRFKHINEVGQQYWSYRQLIGRSLFDIFPRKYAQNYYELIKEVVEQGKTLSGDVEASIDGRIFWFYTNLSVVKNKDGEVDSVVLSAWDITERKQMESNLKTSEAHFRAMFEENTSVMILADPKSGRFLDANAAACQFYGYDHDTVTSMYIDQISDTDIRDIQSQLQPDAIKENQFYIAKHRLANGEIRTVENRISPIEIDGEILLLGVVVDISQRIKAENRLLEQERDLALIVDGSQAGTWSWWVGTERSAFNERWAEIVGYELEELTQGDVNTWVNLAHPEDQKVWDEQVQRHIRGELDTLEEEIRMRHKDGHWVWVQVHGKIVERDKDGAPLRLSGIHLDISDRKAAEEKLVASEKKLKSLMETETHFVLRTDMEGRYTCWNAPFEEEFGWLFEPEGIRGAYSLQAIKAYHHEKVHKTVEKCVLNPGKVFQVEIDMPAKDENTRTTLWEFICLTDENDQPTEIQSMGV
ncbi:MAG: PAS domain S-box protein [Anaerolineae bacterium]|nr:PAS domain S-box protein [Anaerolineae bacterium]